MGAIAAETNVAVLMARIVDRAGALASPASFDSIEFTLIELERDGQVGRLVAGRVGVPLAVGEVLFDSLHLDGLWSHDTCGYNFRHEVELPADARGESRGRRYRLSYAFAPFTDSPSVIQFDIKGNHDD